MCASATAARAGRTATGSAAANMWRSRGSACRDRPRHAGRVPKPMGTSAGMPDGGRCYRLARLTALVFLLAPSVNAGADPCPAALAGATRLVLVVAPDMRAVTATLRRFERSGPGAPWHEIGMAAPAVVGKRSEERRVG